MKRKESSRSDEDQPRKKTKINNEAITNPFDLLPDEILREILRYLNGHDLRWTRLVDSRLFKVVDMHHFNIGLVLGSEMPEVTRVFGRYDGPIGLTFRKPHFFRRDSELPQLTQLTQLVSLDFGANSSVRIDIFQNLTNLHSLTALYVSPSDLQHHTQLTNLVAQCPVVDQVLIESGQQVFPAHLRHLSFKEIYYFNNETSKIDARGVPNIKYSGRSKVKHKFLLGIKCHLTGLESLSTGTAVADLPVSTMTGLTVLVNYDDEDDDVNNNNDDIIQWDITHLTNLRHLEINHENILLRNSLLPFKLLESFTLQRATIGERHLTQLISSQITQLDICIGYPHVIKHITSFSNLRRLALTSSVTIQGMELDLAELSHLTRLTNLNILRYWSKVKNIESINNLTKLMELDFVMRKKRFDSTTQVISLRNLTRLTRLVLSRAMPLVDLSNMTNLMHLEYERNQASLGLSSLHNLTHLNSHSEWSHDIANLTSLRELTLGFDCQISDEDVMALSSLTQLTLLNAFTSGSGEHLTRLTRLQYLELTTETGTQKILDQLQTKLIYCEPLLYGISYE